MDKHFEVQTASENFIKTINTNIWKPNVLHVLTTHLQERGNLIGLKIGQKAVTVQFSPISFWSDMI